MAERDPTRGRFETFADLAAALAAIRDAGGLSARNDDRECVAAALRLLRTAGEASFETASELMLRDALRAIGAARGATTTREAFLSFRALTVPILAELENRQPPVEPPPMRTLLQAERRGLDALLDRLALTAVELQPDAAEVDVPEESSEALYSLTNGIAIEVPDARSAARLLLSQAELGVGANTAPRASTDPVMAARLRGEPPAEIRRIAAEHAEMMERMRQRRADARRAAVSKSYRDAGRKGAKVANDASSEARKELLGELRTELAKALKSAGFRAKWARARRPGQARLLIEFVDTQRRKRWKGPSGTSPRPFPWTKRRVADEIRFILESSKGISGLG